MVVKVEYTRTCDGCAYEIGRQSWRVSLSPEIAMAKPNLRDNVYMVNGVYSILCDDCAKPLKIAIKLVGATRKEQSDEG